MSTFNRNTLAAALAVAVASVVSAPAMASGTVTAAVQAPFAFEVTKASVTGDPRAVAQGFGFNVLIPDILIGRTNASGNVTVFVTFSGADLNTAPVPAVPATQGTLGGAIFSGNVLQFTITPPVGPGMTAGSLFTVPSLDLKNALGLQSGGAGVNATVRIVDTNTGIELLGNTSGAILSGAPGTKTVLGAAVGLTVDVTLPSQKKQFLIGIVNQPWAQVGSVVVSLNDTDSVAVGIQGASTTGTGATTNASAAAPAASTFVYNPAADKLDITLTVPSPTAFSPSGTAPAPIIFGGFYADTAACAGVVGAGTAFTKSPTDATKYTVAGLALLATGQTYNICSIANGVSTIGNQTISAVAQIKLAGALTINPAAASGDIANIGFNGTVVNVATFNPAGNVTQESFLRVSNTSSIDGLVTVEGTDDNGVAQTAPIKFNLGAGKSLQFNSTDLESGNAIKFTSGAFGDHTGKWRLVVTGEFSGMKVTSLNRNNTTGTLTDLSSISNANQ